MTKVTIISGFLGAGKTTFIKKLIEEIYKGQKVVLIENEFGEIGIDGGFLKDAGVQINEMNSGCICCSLVGDFGKALKQVSHDYAPDMIIIEPSGVGKLSDVIAAVENVKEEADLELENFITVADATKCKLYMKNFGEFYNNQIESATTVVLSRTQNVDEAKLETAVNLIKEHNDKASIITTPWDELTGEQIISALKHTSLVDDMLKDMQEKKIHMGIVVDEYGQTAGIVSMEDIIEEIVGNILDEYDDEEEVVEYAGDDTYVVDGLTAIEDINSLLGIKIESDGFETLNGFLISKLGRIASENETEVIEAYGFSFKILEVTGNVIRKVEITKIDKKEGIDDEQLQN